MLKQPQVQLIKSTWSVNWWDSLSAMCIVLSNSCKRITSWSSTFAAKMRNRHWCENLDSLSNIRGSGCGFSVLIFMRVAEAWHHGPMQRHTSSLSQAEARSRMWKQARAVKNGAETTPSGQMPRETLSGGNTGVHLQSSAVWSMRPIRDTGEHINLDQETPQHYQSCTISPQGSRPSLTSHSETAAIVKIQYLMALNEKEEYEVSRRLFDFFGIYPPTNHFHCWPSKWSLVRRSSITLSAVSHHVLSSLSHTYINLFLRG